MIRNTSLIALTAAVVALPFIFQRPAPDGGWRAGDPVLIAITPHNEAIRYEFGQAFSAWHQQHHGQPVKIDWRIIGGTTEIMRYLEAEALASFRAWWQAQGRTWPVGAGDVVLDRKFNATAPSAEIQADSSRLAAWTLQRDLHTAFRTTDDPAAFSCQIDVFFGGGAYDHGKAAGEGLSVVPWAEGQAPVGTLVSVEGQELIPAQLGGELWRTDRFFGCALSTFGICYNPDRLRDLGIAAAPQCWADLADPAYRGQIGVADPTKSGSIAKAFEMMVHEQCWIAVRAAGFSAEDVERFEGLIRKAGLAPGVMPDDVPATYQAAIEKGWLEGVRLVQRIGANARYFTDSAGKVPIDVSMGDAAAGVAIDFYGRYQAEMSRAPDGSERMAYVTPRGGSSVSSDPISILRGAPNRELAMRFLEFVLSEEGQRLWNYRPGTPGGPEKFALRRLPIRRDFYPATAGGTTVHTPHLSDDLGSPDINPFELGEAFVYQPRWTGGHFNVMRDLIRAMCLDAGEELREAWSTVIAAGGPAEQPEVMALLGRMPDQPVPLTWASALDIPRQHDRLDYMRAWTRFFRESYGEVSR